MQTPCQPKRQPSDKKAHLEMSYMPAKFFEDNGVPSMALKGRIKVGVDADITIFNLKTVRDNATYEKGGLPS